MRKTIAIDASRAIKPFRTGTENYSYHIIQNLVNLTDEYHFVLYAPHLPKENFFHFKQKVEWRLIKRHRLWSQIGLANEIRRNPPDVLFVPSHVIPLMSKVPSVVTIHDLAYKFFPSSYPYMQRRYLDFTTSASCAKARKIITPSQSTKNDLIRFYRTSAEKITVIPHGIDPIFFQDTSELASPLENPYILFIGRLEEKKNLMLLIEAFKLLSNERKKISLVLAGRSGYGFIKLKQAIEELPPTIRENITMPGYLTIYDMIRYLKNATVFAFPSYYEGFGLPILEAYAMKVPVVASNTSSLKEVAGSCAILLPPTSPLSWASAFSRIINQQHIAQKMKLCAQEHIKNYSWLKSAKMTLEVIKDVLK